MSITLIITMSYDKDFNETGQEILEDEWQDFVESQDNLRFRSEPHVAINPSTGAKIEITPSPEEAELLIKNEWYPFLNYRDGELCMRYLEEYECKDNPIRKAISGVAGFFAAVITHDAGDEILEW